MSSETADVLTARYGPAYRWLVTGAVLLAMVAMVLSSTSVAVAVPNVMGAFGVGQDKAQWIATAFFASQVATMLLNAWLVSVFGQRATFIGTLVVAIFACFLGGLAHSLEFVILSRILQGACAGIIQPLSMMTIFTVFPPERRGTAMGLFGLGVVLAPAFGPTLGGIVIDTFSWRAVFYLPLPLCLVALLLGSIFMPTKTPGSPSRPFDYLGFLLMVTALTCLLNGFASGQREGWTSDIIVAQLVGGALAVVFFVTWQLHARSPLLDLTLFRNPQFASAAVVGFIFGFGMFGSIFITALFVQTVQGYTPTRAGLLLMPGGLMMAMIFPLAGRIVDTIPAHIPIMIGQALFGVGFIMMAGADANTAFWTFVLFTLVNRFGLAMTMPPLNTAALRALRPEQVSQGSGAINFVRMLGGACGVNLLVVFLEMRTRFHAEGLTATQSFANSTSRELLDSVEGLLAQSGVAEAHQLPGALHYLGQMVHAQASALAFQDTFLAAAALAIFAVLPAWMMGRAHAAGRQGQAVAA
ncbi:MAG: DHA2 family efflux MFS transporter permease subunit [Alphaproteobacteria bacterium]